jgi:hypothetical protein
VFTEFEVYVHLPEAVVPGRVRGWLQLGQPGWDGKEQVRRRAESVESFFAKPLADWKMAGSKGRVLGPGLAVEKTKVWEEERGAESYVEYVPDSESEGNGELVERTAEGDVRRWRRFRRRGGDRLPERRVQRSRVRRSGARNRDVSDAEVCAGVARGDCR